MDGLDRTEGNQKIENLLNLALETPEEVRERTEELNVGFNREEKTWELIVKYNGSPERLRGLGIGVEDLLAGYAILTVPENRVEQIAGLPFIEYVEKPKSLFFAVQQGKEASCILPVTLRPPYLTGQGVLVAVIDSGIDYTNRHFRNADGSSRILYLWDQSIHAQGTLSQGPPEGFLMGAEFTKQELDEALAMTDPAKRFLAVPSVDTSGHGTAVAGIAAGNAIAGNGGNYSGVAPGSGIIAVKMGIPQENSFPRTTELMRAVTYVVNKAAQLSMPVAINLSFGNTYGAHNGTSLVERFLDNAAEVGRNVICIGSGNEGSSFGHTGGRFGQMNAGSAGAEGGAGMQARRIEMTVGAFETTLNLQIWKNYADVYRIRLLSPDGAETELPLGTQGGQTLTVGKNRLLLYVGSATPYAVTQEIYLDFLPANARGYLTSGIWTIVIEPVRITDGAYELYLPVGTTRNRDTGFLAPEVNLTLTIPSTAGKAITVGAYDTEYDAYADFSGRGADTGGLFTGVSAGRDKPDLVAPGVNILAPDTFLGYGVFTGTSFAVPFVTGAAALLMEWGIVQGNDSYLYGEKIKAYFRKGARPLRSEAILPNPRVGYGALCVQNSISDLQQMAGGGIISL